MPLLQNSGFIEFFTKLQSRALHKTIYATSSRICGLAEAMPLLQNSGFIEFFTKL